MLPDVSTQYFEISASGKNEFQAGFRSYGQPLMENKRKTPAVVPSEVQVPDQSTIFCAIVATGRPSKQTDTIWQHKFIGFALINLQNQCY